MNIEKLDEEFEPAHKLEERRDKLDSLWAYQRAKTRKSKELQNIECLKKRSTCLACRNAAIASRNGISSKSS